MKKERIFSMNSSSIYNALVNKAVKKGRSQDEVDTVIKWLTGYDDFGLKEVLENEVTYEEFFEKAPHMNPNRKKITGSICGVKVQEIEDPLMQDIRYLDKLVDELAKGKSMDKILRV